MPCRVRRALDLKSSASTLPQNALAAMHGHCGMLRSAAAPLGPWQAALDGPLVPGLHSAPAAAHSRLGMAGLARAVPAKRSLSPIAEHSDMSPVAVSRTQHACCSLGWWGTGRISINQRLACHAGGVMCMDAGSLAQAGKIMPCSNSNRCAAGEDEGGSAHGSLCRWGCQLLCCPELE